MISYILRRVAMTIPVLIGITLLLFVSIRLLPGDPALYLAGEFAPVEYVEQIRHDQGLDQPVLVQYAIYLRNVSRGDLGRSVKSRRPVFDEVRDRLPFTVQLAASGMLVAAAIGLSTGIVSAIRRRSPLDYLSMVVALLGISVPIFWLGLMLILFFAVTLHLVPAGGTGSPAHMVLPALTLGLSAAGILARLTRSSMLEVLDSDYVRTARAKGLREVVVILRHAFANAAIPVLTVLGLQFGYLMGGAVITESVFGLPGMGRLILDAIVSRDYPLVQGALLTFATLFALVNLIVDVLYVVVDPRIRLG